MICFILTGLGCCCYCWLVGRRWRFRRMEQNQRHFQRLLKQFPTYKPQCKTSKFRDGDQQKSTQTTSDFANVNSHDGTTVMMEFADGCREIERRLAELEFPLVYHLSLEFALYRTCAIPSISSLLYKTGRFTGGAHSTGKRCDDSNLLVCEMLQHSLNSKRSQYALNRLNAIHGQYSKKFISNQDMIYVLSLFVLLPIQWIARIEWRPLAHEEEWALFFLWRHLGQRMGIQDIPSTLPELKHWRQLYEQRFMVYSQTNFLVSNAILELFIRSILPLSSLFEGLARRVIGCFIDDCLLEALNYKHKPHAWLKGIVFGFLRFRRMILRYICFLPRPNWLSRHYIPKSKNGGDAAPTTVVHPRFGLYGPTYQKNGYRPCNLGGAPMGKVFATGQCPIYA